MQDEMNRLFAEGGVMQEGGTVDPVSGNEVPPGAMQEEVRDDIPAQLSEGEFVFPADVVRFIGLQTLMKLRDKAKMGLKRMNDIGQMGNAEEVPDGEALFGGEEMDDEMFSDEIDSIMAEEEEGGDENRNYAAGGYVSPENQQLYRDAPIKGFEMVPMVNDAGQTIFIPFINGVAQLGIPAGFKVKPAATQTPTTTDTTTTNTDTTGGGGGGGDSTSDTGSSSPSSPGFSISETGLAVPNETSPVAASVIGAVVSAVTGIPGLSTIGKSIAEQSNFSNAQAAMGFNVAVSDTTNAANTEGVTSAAATTGPGGTGGAAASAAAAAAAAASANGHSDAAVGAASQAAADAAVSGADAAAAAAAGAAAAEGVDGPGGGGIGDSGPGGSSGEAGAAAAGAGPGGPGAAAAAAGADGAAAGADGAAAGADGAAAGADGAAAGGDGDGDGYAKGGFVSKHKISTKSIKQKGLASKK